LEFKIMSLTKQQVRIRELILSAAGAMVQSDAALDKANETRKGGYTAFVEAAVEAGNRETFDRETEAVFADIRANAGGVAETLGCKLGKGRKGSAPGYLIPGSLSNAKSIIGKAWDYKVPLTVTADGKTEVRAFRKIRDEVAKHDNAARLAGLDARGKRLHLIRTMAQQVADAAEAYTEAEVPKVVKALTELVKLASGAIDRQTKAQAEAKAASKGAELAEAPKAAAKAA
jgi:hypothetical protein